MSTEVESPPRGALVVLALAAMAFALAQTAVIPAMSGMAQSLHASPQSVAWVLTGYLVSAAILTPVLGRLGDMFGKRGMLVVSLVLFAAGAVLAAVSPNIWLLVVARVLQGAGGGIFPLCFGIISDDFPPTRRPGALGLISAIAGIGAGAGLLMGGLLIDHASYHWIFWSGAIMAVLAIIGVRTLPASGQRTPGKVDYVGALLLAAGITAPLIALTKTREWGWTDTRTLGLIAGGIVILVLFGLFERRVKQPLVDMSVFARPAVLITNINTLLAGFAMFGAFSLIPQIAQTPTASGYGLGMNATGAGLLLLPACLMMLAAGPISGKLSLRYGGRFPLTLGVLIAAAGLGLLAANHNSQAAVLGYAMVVFAGIGLAFAATPNLIVDAVPRSMTGQTTGINALIRSLGSSIGSQIAATLLAVGVTATHPLPTDSAFTQTFTIGAAAAVLAGITALFIPRTLAQPEGVALTAPELTAASQPPQTVYADTGSSEPEEGSVIRGVVRGGDDLPVAHAALTLIDVRGHQVGRATTRDDGRYRLPIPGNGTYVLIASTGDYDPQAATLMVGDQPSDFDLKLTGFGGLAGAVHEVHGTPVPDAIVVLTDARGEVVATGTTDTDGTYAFTQVPTGTYTLTVTATGYRPSTTPIEIGRDQTHQDVELLAAARIHGTVRAERGRPLPDARVTLLDAAENLVGLTTTGPHGQYAFTDLIDGHYTLTAAGYPPVISSVTLNGPGEYSHSVWLDHPAQ